MNRTTQILSVAATGVLAFVVGLGISANNDDDDARRTSPVPTHTEASCTARLKDFNRQTDTLTIRVNGLDAFSPDSEVRSFINDARDLFDEGRQIVSDCRKFAPAEVDDFDRSLDDFDNMINSLEEVWF